MNSVLIELNETSPDIYNINNIRKYEDKTMHDIITFIEQSSDKREIEYIKQIHEIIDNHAHLLECSTNSDEMIIFINN